MASSINMDIVKEFWQYVYFTDEAHINASLIGSNRILCEPGTRYKPENLLQTPKLEGYSFYITAYVNWNEIGPLKFYNNS